ncbi:MAG: hypothetical protein Q9198_004089 [Flavoplaca austrocitrina]
MEDDLPELYECMRTLQDIFQTSYHYTCEDIVLKQNTGENKRRVDVQTTLLRIMHQYEGPETLIILYYGGHSMMLEQPMMQTIVSSQSAEMRGSTQLHTMNLVDVMNATLELHDSDVAYLLDSCYGTSLALKTGKELLASSSVEIVSTASGMTGFTRQLCDLLEKQERKPITLAHIHAKLLKKHFAGIDNTIMGLELTPVHTELNPNQQGSLILAPLRTSSFRNPVPWPSRNVPFLDRDHLKVQISVHMWNTKIPELQNWVKWLTTNKPPFIRELEISVATACKTGSLLVTLIIPAAVHSAMHGNPAYQMIGRWCIFEVDLVKDVDYNVTAFENLMLDEKYKQMISALIKVHTEVQLSFDDVIKGKGKGLIFLLHGIPGVGKSLKAGTKRAEERIFITVFSTDEEIESVADTCKRPLYTVTAGDLGTSAADVELGMGKALRLAERWNAIVLIDEADVFLEQRKTSDLVRNGLVSVLLRLLEYYQGIMFLATNRIESFDQAFQSRVHLAVKYPALSSTFRKNLWRIFLQKASPGFSLEWLDSESLERLASEDLNGRQIKNIALTAYALAVSESTALNFTHIEIALSAVQAFKSDCDEVVMRD